MTETSGAVRPRSRERKIRPKHGAWIAAIVTTLVVMVLQRDVGIARDETVYMAAGDRYAEWWTGLVKWKHGLDGKLIDQTFGGAFGGGGNPEHPPLVKLASGLSHRWLSGVLGDPSAYRLPSAILHGILAYLVFVMVLEIWGLAEAVLAWVCLLLLPRALFHAGLDCFDAPTMTLWFASIYAYWRCLDGRKWPWQAGVVWGLALATKHTALLLPFAIALHYAVIAWRAKNWKVHWRVPVAMAVIGPLVLLVLWPWLWLDPIGHIKGWLQFHSNHVHYNFEYLGTNWNHPRFPWHVALVTTLFTVPTTTLVAAAIGAGTWIAKLRERTDRAPVLLLVLSAAASIAPFFLGTTPIFGAEKHWMPILPTICIAAGVGGIWAARQLTRIPPRIAYAAVIGSIALAGASEVMVSHPYALTWYSALAGGSPGGADHGMNRQFWGVAARGILPELATQPPGSVYSHDASPAWHYYQQYGDLPKGYPDSGPEASGIAASKYALVIHEKHFNRHDYMIWKSYGTTQPIFVLRSDGVPIVSLYKRP
ncbi:MAG TPA: glycosyltransferase family 39 protein [Kofleriaceae bacterium]